MRIKWNSDICLKGLRFHAYHGVLPQERRTGNDYVMDVAVTYPFTHALETDDLADTINYAELYAVIDREMAQPSRLIEHVAGRIAHAILSRWPNVQAVDISLTKLNPPIGADLQGAGVHLNLINDKIGT